MRTLMIVAIAGLVAGCIESTSNLSTTQGPTASCSVPPVRATATAATAAPSEETGSLTVTVVTTELAPVEAAQVVVVETDESLFTDAAGAATFNGLNPGSYTVLAAKPGYRALQDKGRLVEIAVGEITEVKLTLDPVQVIDANNSYYTTLPFVGFIACALEGQPGFVIGRTTLCGHWLNPGGVSISDPNDKSLFRWTIDSIQIQGIVLEGKWTPSTSMTGQQLRMTVHNSYACSTVSCLSNGWDLNIGGFSPIKGQLLEGTERRITKKYGEDPAAYPKQIWTETLSYCGTNCTGMMVVFQQSFNKYLTAFYGIEPPAEFTALPP